MNEHPSKNEPEGKSADGRGLDTTEGKQEERVVKTGGFGGRKESSGNIINLSHQILSRD